MLVHILYTLFYLAVVLLIFKKAPFFNTNGLNFKINLSFFLVKLLAGIALIYIYTEIYTDRTKNDIFRYFDSGTKLFDNLNGNPLKLISLFLGNADSLAKGVKYWDFESKLSLFHNNQLIITTNALLHFVSFGFYGIHALLFAFFAHTGGVGLFHFFTKYTDVKTKHLLVVVFLVPSVLFWTAGVLKESLLLGFTGIGLWAFTKLYHKQLKHWLLFLACLFFVSILQVYFFLFLTLGLLLWQVQQHVINVKFWVKLALFALLFLTALYADKLFGTKNIIEIARQRQLDFINVAKTEGAKSYVEIPNIDNSLDFFKAMPIAFFNVLLHPHLFEVKSLLYLVPALENAILFVLIFYKLLKFRQLKTIYHKAYFEEFCLVVAIFGLFVIGMTTPVVGAIVRYKVIYMPFLLVAILKKMP